ncbi:oligosaccharide flippase family protein [Paeniroseomonas aquatica]|uniref:oligosaccharide flippase family protein n=1 Tax=Paeniroseomonas aquatica TaxID=373043 RepID=UPI00361CAC23
MLAESIAAAIFSFASMMLIGRVIGPHAAGVGTIAIATFLLLEVFGATLFPDLLVQHPKLAERHASSAATASVLLGLVLSLAMAAASPFIADRTGSPEVVWLILALAPMMPLAAFSGTASGLLLRDQRYRLMSLRLLVGQPLALAAGLGAAAAGYGPWAMVINQCVSTVVTFLLLLRGGRLRLRPQLDRAALAELWPVAGPQVAGVAVLVGRYRLFLLALGFVVSQSVLAVSHFAFRLLDAALAVVWQTVGRLAMPRLCALQHDRPAMAEAYGELAQLQALLGLPIAAGLALIAPDLVHTLLGPEWAGAASAARVAGVAVMFTFLYGDQISLFVAVGKAKWNFYVAFGTLVLPMIALVLLKPETPEDVALVWGAQCILFAPLLTWLVLREIHRSVWWLARRIAPGVLATLAMAVVVALVQQGLNLPPAVRILAAIGAGGATYIGVAWLALGGRLPPALLRAALVRS